MQLVIANKSHKAAVTALALACTFCATPLLAQYVTPPPTPAAITPPSGNTAFLLGHAVGTQGYICLPSGSGFTWLIKGSSSRPEATLFTTLFGNFSLEISTHFLSPDTNPNSFAPSPLPFGSPAWQNSFDSSVVWGNKLASITAGSDPSCPTSGAIACLLLQAIGSANGPAGGSFMTVTTYIQRLNTTGGIAPATGCALSTDVGTQVLVPYTADYYFYKAQ